MAKIKIIIGSTRPGRFGDKPGRWINELAKEYKNGDFELLDLKEINLPFLDEPQPPAAGDYQHQHTKDWAAKIDEADGFIFVTAEYNHGTPAAIKNAIDFAGKEWQHKPAVFVSYGAEAGGARAVEQLRNSLTQLAAFPLKEQVVIANYWDNINEKGEFVPNDYHDKKADELLKSITLWADEFAQIRKKLS